jgi:hypothetical protein
MATTSQNIQMIHFKADGSQTILNPKTLANLISVDRTGNSNIPTAVTNLQTLANSLGSLAFKSAIQPMGGASSGLAGSAGLVPAPTAGSQGKFLRGDGSWASIDQVSYSAFKGATQTAVGVIGLVPAPAAGSQNMFLRGDGTWGNPPKANFPVFTGATTTADGAAGLVTAPKVANRLQFLRGDGTWATPTDTKYTHPTHTAYASGMYKFTSDGLGHITSATAVTKEDITKLGIPGTDTNTWRGVQDNLTSTTTDQSLSANQGKVLKGLIDGKAAASHTHAIADINDLSDTLNDMMAIKVQAETPTGPCLWYKIDTE